MNDVAEHHAYSSSKAKQSKAKQSKASRKRANVKQRAHKSPEAKPKVVVLGLPFLCNQRNRGDNHNDAKFRVVMEVEGG